MKRPTKPVPFAPRDMAAPGPCGCGCGETAKARRRWFNPKCRQAWLLTWDWNSMRLHVVKRDGSNCALCGIDTRLVAQACSVLCRMARFVRWLMRTTGAPHWRAAYMVDDRIKARLAEHAGRSRRFWRLHHSEPRGYEIDHIVPLIEGGPHHVDNLRVLCPRCHRAATAALAARRALARRTSDPVQGVATGSNVMASP